MRNFTRFSFLTIQDCTDMRSYPKYGLQATVERARNPLTNLLRSDSRKAMGGERSDVERANMACAFTAITLKRPASSAEGVNVE